MEEKVGFLKKLKNGLSKTRQSFISGVDSLFNGFSEIDDEFYEELEELLVMADIGINTTMSIIDGLKEKVKKEKIKEAGACKQLLIDTIKSQMQVHENAYEFLNRKSVLLLIGVNGVGKTTSVGKLAGQFKSMGKKVVLAAADTFRAGAIEQLKEWANRAGVDIIAGQEGSDPAAIVYDAVAAARAREVPGRFVRNSYCRGRDNRAECIGAGERIQRGGRCVRGGSHKTGWYGEGRYCHCHTV